MNDNDEPGIILPDAPTVIRRSDHTWYEAGYAAAAAYLVDLDERLGGDVQVMVEGRELSSVERAAMLARGRAEAGDRRITLPLGDRELDVLVTRDAMRVLWGADQDARSDAIVDRHRPFLETLARTKVAEEGEGADGTVVLTSTDIEG